MAFVANKPQNTVEPKRRLLKPRDVAARLSISTDTLDRFIRRGVVPVIKLPSRQRRIDEAVLDQVIADWKAASQ